MSARLYTQFNYSLHKRPIEIDCQFVVARADSAGNGLTGLIGPGIKAVYMHTSATPSAGNPNPADGSIVVQFQDTYKVLFVADQALASPNSGTGIVITSAGAHIVAGTPYVITVVGTSTLADWQAIGLPQGQTPAIGMAFIGSSTTGSGSGSGQVQIAKSTGTGITNIEQVGLPSSSLSSTVYSSAPYAVFQCMKNSAKTQPADGTVISMRFLLTDSSILNQGG